MKTKRKSGIAPSTLALKDSPRDKKHVPSEDRVKIKGFTDSERNHACIVCRVTSASITESSMQNVTLWSHHNFTGHNDQNFARGERWGSRKLVERTPGGAAAEIGLTTLDILVV
ncbi:hypothetical protein FRC20_007914 [Serendipita sp. 405]|nr:hypothetical protein FRC20_007914 [Serendipita sp. 405]